MWRSNASFEWGVQVFVEDDEPQNVLTRDLAREKHWVMCTWGGGTLIILSTAVLKKNTYEKQKNKRPF